MQILVQRAEMLFNIVCLLLLSYAAQGCGVASSAEDVGAPLMQFVHGAGDSSPTLCERHRGIFDVHKLIPADETPLPTQSNSI